MAENIECFDELTGKIFAELYESFPVPTLLMTDSYLLYLIGKNPDHPGEPKFEDSEEARIFYDATLSWLETAGFIHRSETTVGICSTCVLTAKGLEALKAVPSSIGGQSLGDSLKAAAKDGALEQLRSLAGQAIGVGVKLGTAYLGIPSS